MHTLVLETLIQIHRLEKSHRSRERPLVSNSSPPGYSCHHYLYRTAEYRNISYQYNWPQHDLTYSQLFTLSMRTQVLVNAGDLFVSASTIYFRSTRGLANKLLRWTKPCLQVNLVIIGIIITTLIMGIIIIMTCLYHRG